MNPKDICYASIDDLRQSYADGSLTPSDVADALLRRMKVVDKNVNSYVTIMEESLRKEALEADKEVKRSGDSKSLLGIPVGLKDAIDVAGVRTTRGSKLFENHVAREDAEIVRRFKAQGCLLTGKLNMDEFAFGLTTDCSHFGPTKNPWDLSRISGGSSGGSAAAVAAGLCTGSIGTDAGGSVRVPSSLCGVVGLKPTYGVVNPSGISPFCWSITHVGPVARTVKDVRTIFNAMIDDSVKDHPLLTLSIARASKFGKGLEGLKIGVLREYFHPATDEKVENLFLKGLDVLQGLGAEVTDVSIPVFDYSRAAGSVIIACESASIYLDDLRNRKQDMVKEIQTRLMVGTILTALDYVTAQKVRRLVREGISKALKSVNILAVPTTPITAPPIKATHVEVRGKQVRLYNLLARFTTVFSMAGVPALSVPCGTTNDRLPVGLQLIGRVLDEHTLFKVAELYEESSKFPAKLKKELA